ncbi:hypothetical protein [Magnetospirillum sulfuroxidans]|uniref:Uncharacterized protein n=1 Tax=Magnetospirillum sulfuroxidans TaxID=611300 RepID=A0ABS5ICH8_9PROT|nr:hypothetical protein [Magnetospirillum sulfuroxidans]MBR9972129.1 hypothetical protein [Magnetospirillum sulfuroxidans]
MRIGSYFVGLVLNVVMVLPSMAAERAMDLLDPAVSFTADFQVSGDKGNYHGTVWHAPGRERRDFGTKDGGQAVILRRDSDSAYLLKPSGHWYVGLGFAAVATLAGGLDSLTVERSRVGTDTVAGLKATRFKVSGSGPKGSRFDGHAWFSAEGIMLKAAGTLSSGDGRRSEVETTLSNVRIGRVEERMFELPAGWFGMDLRSVPPERLALALESLRPLLEGRGAHQ